MAVILRPVGAVLLLAAAGFFTTGPVRAQIDPAVRDRVFPAAVQIAVRMTWQEGNLVLDLPFVSGSGTMVSPTGLILTQAVEKGLPRLLVCATWSSTNR